MEKDSKYWLIARAFQQSIERDCGTSRARSSLLPMCFCMHSLFLARTNSPFQEAAENFNHSGLGFCIPNHISQHFLRHQNLQSCSTIARNHTPTFCAPPPPVPLSRRRGQRRKTLNDINQSSAHAVHPELNVTIRIAYMPPPPYSKQMPLMQSS